MNRSLALFDFDGTITSKDTLFEFILYAKGRMNFIIGMVALLPVFTAFLLRIIPNWRAKEMVLSFFFNGMSLKEFQSKCDLFSADKIPHMLRPDALNKIAGHIHQGDRIIIVSASPENWVGRWAEMQGLEWIATRLESINGCITGKISGKNCYGTEKVVRINEYVDIALFDKIYTYGDTASDWPMLQLGTSIHFKSFEHVEEL